MIFGFAPVLRTLSSRFAGSREWNSDRRLSTLRDALAAIEAGQWDEAENALKDGGPSAMSDSACLNLLGIVHQARREWKQARRFFGKAMRADRHYAPAEQNMRRIYELFTFGNTNLPISLADPLTLHQIRREESNPRFDLPRMRQ